jgi:DNA-binding beta-propeller fold protein YncE
MTARVSRFAGWVCLGILSLLAITLIGCSSGGPGEEHSLFGAPAGPIPKFAYVANRGTNNVSAYTVNASTGALTPVAGSPFAAGSFAEGVAVDPAGKFEYVKKTSEDRVSA